jgi:nucleoside-diphosphate-sugar epimerase
MRADFLPATFFTGATGFLGQFVLRDLLVRGHRIVALVRGSLSDATVRLRNLLLPIGVDINEYIEQGRLRLVDGALPDSLPEGDLGPIDSVINCAASIQLFSNGNGDPFKTNVAGTQAMIDWVERRGIRRIFAVSTAYTCGWNSGVIREEFHHPEPKFQTDYERSKWIAECLLQEWSARSGNVLTVFRPSFLIGDSKSGYTTQFGGFCQFARLVSVLKQQFSHNGNGDRTYIPLRIPGRPEDRQNIVPVDYVARMIAEVVLRPEFQGRIYHLTNPEPPTNDLMKRCYEDYFGLHGGYFADPDEVVGKCSKAESLLWDRYELITPRVVHTPHFDVRNAREVAAAIGLEFPVLDKQRIFTMFDYAAAHRWGRGTDGFHG